MNPEYKNVEIKGNTRQEYYEHYSFIVDPGQGPDRIDRFLANRIQNVSRSKIQSASDAGCILVDDKPVKSSYIIKPGDRISVRMLFPPRNVEVIPQDIPLNILYEDDNLLIINKEAGMVVHPAYGNFSGTLVNALVYYLKDVPIFSTGEIRPGLVHRIDKGTSGLLVIAKDEHSKMKLARQFYEKKTKRKYLALVWGNFNDETGTINGNIGRHLKNRKIMDVFPHGDHGKPAVTHYKVTERLGYISLVECQLETGRTHQIRAHFKFIGHPLFNDHEYGGDQILKGTTFSKYRQFVVNCFDIMPRQALHAFSIGFEHPFTREQMHFEAPPPEDFKTVLEKWRKYSSFNII